MLTCTMRHRRRKRRIHSSDRATPQQERRNRCVRNSLRSPYSPSPPSDWPAAQPAGGPVRAVMAPRPPNSCSAPGARKTHSCGRTTSSPHSRRATPASPSSTPPRSTRTTTTRPSSPRSRAAPGPISSCAGRSTSTDRGSSRAISSRSTASRRSARSPESALAAWEGDDGDPLLRPCGIRAGRLLLQHRDLRRAGTRASEDPRGVPRRAREDRIRRHLRAPGARIGRRLAARVQRALPGRPERVERRGGQTGAHRRHEEAHRSRFRRRLPRVRFVQRLPPRRVRIDLVRGYDPALHPRQGGDPARRLLADQSGDFDGGARRRRLRRSSGRGDRPALPAGDGRHGDRLNASSEHKEAATEFLEWLGTPPSSSSST